VPAADRTAATYRSSRDPVAAFECRRPSEPTIAHAVAPSRRRPADGRFGDVMLNPTSCGGGGDPAPRGFDHAATFCRLNFPPMRVAITDSSAIRPSRAIPTTVDMTIGHQESQVFARGTVEPCLAWPRYFAQAARRERSRLTPRRDLRRFTAG
jgi:hypothetical protein